MDPCTLPSSFGWNFIIFFAVCSTVYVGGGIAYNHKVKGERLAYENARQLFPHVEHWQALAGLVGDGISFSKASWDACVYRVPQTSRALPVPFSAAACHLTLARHTNFDCAMHNANRYREASGAVAQVAGSVGGYESLADIDEPSEVPKPTPVPAGAALGESSTLLESPFDAARSGSESDDGDGSGVEEAGGSASEVQQIGPSA